MIPLLLAFAAVGSRAGNSASVDALIYSTMPSTSAYRPEYAMDGDPKTSFRSYYGMDDGDSFTLIFGRPIPIRSVQVATGANGDEILSDATVELSGDAVTFRPGADFDAQGVAAVKRGSKGVQAIRIRMKPRHSSSHLRISEITVDSPVRIAHVQQGPPRGFIDLSQATDLADWAADAEKKMESFWPDTAAMLYTAGFITPNAVNVVYRSGPRVTPVAATGGGVMTVNADYARKHRDDTGLVVHEAAHVVQSGGSPGWLIEAIADYIRWIKFEPQNFTYNINPARSGPHDPYRNGAAFLGWCELHYDSRLVSKLNEATRFGHYSDALFEKYCGKPIDVLYKEFIAAYRADKANLLVPQMPESMRPRDLPKVNGSTSPVALTFDKVGVTADGARFGENAGFDDGGAAYSAHLLGPRVTVSGVTFDLGSATSSNILAARGQTLPLSGQHGSLWLLAAAVEGGQHDQGIVVTYQDGSTKRFVQNFSDWYQPEDFPGEIRAVRMTYRNMADGTHDLRPFYVYAYGFGLDASKPLRSVTLPDNSNVRMLAVSMGD